MVKIVNFFENAVLKLNFEKDVFTSSKKIENKNPENENREATKNKFLKSLIMAICPKTKEPIKSPIWTKRRREPFSTPYLFSLEILRIIVSADVHKILAPNPQIIPIKINIAKLLKEKRKKENRQ